jgi:hypothetical protein
MRRHLFLPFAITLPICFLFAVVAYMICSYMDIPDYLSLWAAGNLLSRGISPYDLGPWRELVYQIGWVFLYPLPVAILFIPFGLLPYWFSYFLWLILSQAMIVASALILISFWEYGNKLIYLLPVMAGLVIFRPVIVTVRNGQIVSLLLFLTVLGLLLYLRKRPILAGLALTGLILKPSLGLPVLAGIGFCFLFRKEFKAISGLAVGIALWLGSGFLFDLKWIERFLGIGRDVLDMRWVTAPTIWGVSDYFCKGREQCTNIVSIFGIVVFLALFIFLIWRARHDLFAAVSICTIIPLVISPYAWGYDQILLVIPILYLIGRAAASGWPFLAGGIIFVSISALSFVFVILAIPIERDLYSFLLPVGLFASIAFINSKVPGVSHPRNQEIRI